jgi:hypothetical protein
MVVRVVEKRERPITPEGGPNSREPYMTDLLMKGVSVFSPSIDYSKDV